MATFRISEVAGLLGVGPGTVRRWADIGRLEAVRDEYGHRRIGGADLAMFARARTEECVGGRSSARHRFHGVVTEVVGDAVTARVEITAGPFRVVPPTSRQAADGLGREVGVVATGVVKATDVVVEVPDHEQVTDQV